MFEDFNQIHEICRKYEIENYTINSDGSIDVDGDVDISCLLYVDVFKALGKIPLQFRNVSGYFFCSRNELTTLEGCPSRVGGDFSCYGSRLTSLEGSPKSVGGYFDCQYSNIISFEGLETMIGGKFHCTGNPITEIWDLFRDKHKIELFNYYDIIQDGVVIMDRLNDFLIEIGKNPVEKVYGYKCI